MPKNNQYKVGRSNEKRVAKLLRSKKFKTTLSPGSRGPSDVKAQKGSRKWCVQVKSTTGPETPRMNKEEIRRLKIQSAMSNCVPVIAEVSKRNIMFRSLKTGRTLKP